MGLNTHSHSQTHSAVTEPMRRLISWVASKLKAVLCSHARHNNFLLPLHFSLAGIVGELGGDACETERQSKIKKEREAIG